VNFWTTLALLYLIFICAPKAPVVRPPHVARPRQTAANRYLFFTTAVSMQYFLPLYAALFDLNFFALIFAISEQWSATYLPFTWASTTIFT